MLPTLERHHQKLAPRRVFYRRLWVFAAAAIALMLGWVSIGAVVFHFTLEGANWYDAFRHASLLASGMGPAPELRHTSNIGKVAESIYALISGFVLLGSAGVVAAPIVHRVFHHFHVNDRER